MNEKTAPPFTDGEIAGSGDAVELLIVDLIFEGATFLMIVPENDLSENLRG